MTALLSSRAACVALADAGLVRQQARLLLACGLAGPPTIVGNTVSYDAGTVHALAQRPAVVRAPHLKDRSVLVRRQGRGADPHSTWDAEILLGRPLPIGRSARIWMDIRARHGQPTPCVVTVAGFVAAGFDITRAQSSADGLVHLKWREPGTWFGDFADRRLPDSTGREWAWWPPQPPDAHFTEVKRRTAVRRRAVAETRV